MRVRSGRMRSKVARSQPAKIEMLPVSARWQPPETGQVDGGGRPAPRPSPRGARISASSVVDISIQILPGVRPDSSPSSPSTTRAEMAGEGRQVITASQSRAICAGEVPCFAPRSTSGRMASALRSRDRQVDPVAQQAARQLVPDIAQPDKAYVHVPPPAFVPRQCNAVRAVDILSATCPCRGQRVAWAGPASGLTAGLWLGRVRRMKLRDLEVFVVGNPPPGFGGRYFIFTKLVTDDGITGYGECYGAHRGGPDAMRAVIEDVFARHMEGMSPEDVELMFRRVYGAGFSQRPDPTAMAAFSALEIALLGHPWQGAGGGRSMRCWAGGCRSVSGPIPTSTQRTTRTLPPSTARPSNRRRPRPGWWRRTASRR